MKRLVGWLVSRSDVGWLVDWVELSLSAGQLVILSVARWRSKSVRQLVSKLVSWVGLG